MPSPTDYAWRPQAGPQEAFVKAEAFFDILLGGARGGGKTDACLGEFALHAKKYGNNARGVFMRREMPQADSLIDRSHQIYGPMGWSFHKMERQWTSPDGAILRFRPLEEDRDAEKYQGQFFCVAVGTQIRMAGGATKRIEEIEVGEEVATLLGPRRVAASVAPYSAECVRALVRDASGAVVGEQVHPVWHPVLTTAGLTLKRTEECIRTHGQCERAECASNTPSSVSRRDAGQGIRGWFSFSGGVPNGCTSSESIRRECQQLGRLTVPVVLHGPSSQSRSSSSHGSRGLTKVYRSLCKWLGSCCDQHEVRRRARQRLQMGLERAYALVQSARGFFCPYPTNAAECVFGGFLEAQGSQSDYHAGHGSCDGLFRRGSESAQGDAPWQADVGQPFREAPLGGLGTIPNNIRPGQASWVHPYSGEELDLAQDVSFGTMELEYVGASLVMDLCVEDANHYISDSGLINKNTRVYLEELTNWPSSRAPDKMKATLRSAHGVPVGFRATANPGGPGHSWVKGRYIDPAPQGRVPLVDEAGRLERMFIPARVTDNTALITYDPDYVERLKLTGSKELVRAWLEGDWAVIEGAFFDNFSSARHIVRPFEVPKHWVRFRAMDWGSAAPFSVGWYAVASDDHSLGDGRTLPRGGLVKYREWYGASGPNVGIKLTAEAVAAGIHAREALEKIDYGVLDPAAFAQDGGPSIAERFRYKPHEISFRPADNKRVGSLGHVAGWDLVRHRLDGMGPERPMIVFFDTCRDTIRTFPLAQHDPARVEDLDTKAEDHALDETRYACASRPWIREAPKGDRPIKGLESVTLQRLWDRQAQQKKDRL